MVKIEIELPVELYREIEKYAIRVGSSFSDVCCDGIKNLLQIMPDKPDTNVEWHLPKPQNLGWVADFSDEEIKRIAQDEELGRAFPRD